ncbi:DUF3870 domain-containing protein [Clostridium malenominatum]|uniref:DUF3870 domain-containing protein n=1 Tax=Clostridium malenominatum TaxID=1539 RepID=A0ABN1J5F9_9CLOT
MKYEKNTIYITGVSRANSTDPITVMYNGFFLGMIINKDTGEIIDVTSNAISSMTTDFIKSMLIGYSIVKELDEMINEINNRFFGTAQKALIVALREVHNKFLIEMKKR